MTSATLPRFRAPEFRDLAQEALAQGWDVYRHRGSGHVSAVNPRNGQRVVLSATARAAAGHSLGNARQALIRAGLDLRPPRHRQEAPMQVHDVTPAPVTPEGPREAQARPNQTRAQGGKYAYRGPQEVLDVGGHRVVLGERADGTWVAYTRDLGLRARRRTWYGQDRDALTAKVAQDVAERPPVVEDPVEEAALADSAARLADVHLPEEAAPSRNGKGPGFHVVQADPEEFPLAAALDALDASLAPALVALAAAGKVDAVGLLQAEVARTPIEEELLALYRRVMAGT